MGGEQSATYLTKIKVWKVWYKGVIGKRIICVYVSLTGKALTEGR